MEKKSLQEVVASDVSSNETIANLIPKGEHGIYCYYGRIGQGKTYAMTADILRQLSMGRVVYTNYPIIWKGYDSRLSLARLLFSFFGIVNIFREYPKENLRRLDVDENFHEKLSKLTDCIVALDEGYVAFDSYQMAKMSMKDRQNVLHTRHFDRSIWFTTQRPNAVHVTLRAQTNVFYKVTRMIRLGWLIVFRRQEFDLGSDDSVDEDKCYSTKFYLGSSSVFHAYDTKYLRFGAKSSQDVRILFHKIPYFDRFITFGSLVWQYVLNTFVRDSGVRRGVSSDTPPVDSS